MATTIELNVGDEAPWIVPANVTSVTVECYGGGGGGGGIDGIAQPGGGGGGGGYSRMVMTVQPLDELYFEIGEGGGGSTGFPDASLGFNGGETFVQSDTEICTANGGRGGTVVNGGAACDPGLGDITFGGSAGGAAVDTYGGGGGGGSSAAGAGTAGEAPGGGEAVSPAGFGGQGADGFTPPENGYLLGGGGGGGNENNAAGGDGAHGRIYITYEEDEVAEEVSTLPYATIVDSRDFNYQGPVILNIHTPVGDSETVRNDAKIVRISHPSGYDSAYQVSSYLVGSGVFGTERQRTTYSTGKNLRNR